MFELPAPEDDSLYIPKKKVGEQSKNKHYFLRRYVDAFRLNSLLGTIDEQY